MKRRLQAAACAVMGAAIVVSSCSPTDATRQPDNATPTTAAPAAAFDSDERLATNARARFQSDDSLRAYAIDVAAENGQITLRGVVPTEQAKQQAVSSVRQVEGVESVDDQLTVSADQEQQRQASGARRGEQTMGRADSPGWITTKIQAQYFAHPDISPWNVDVDTNRDGVVTLRGQVEDRRDRDEAVRIARATEGVTQVNDRLTLRSEVGAASAATDTEPDPWITAKVQAKYFLDDEVKGHDIDVDTRNGIVTLRGTVDSERQRRQAVMIARNTEGVRDVTDQLTVTTSAAAGSVTARVDDIWITTKIQSQFFLDRDIKGRNISVDTNSGVVTLQGNVDSAAQRNAAEQIARDTEGVSRVDNQLKVTTTTR